MKKLTKLTTLLLALAMVLTLCVSAYADEEVIEITYFDTLLTEKEARNLLKQLEESGLVKIGSGRAGSRLTQKGVELAGQMQKQGGK